MTAQAPYPQYPPAAAVQPAATYPTAPPWAPPAAAEVAPPYVPHGGLLVPYPEEMRNADRARAPRWWPVVFWTFFFGVFGAISAARRAGQARRGRHSVTPYWVAFAVTAVAGGVWWSTAVAVVVPVYLHHREGAITTLVQEHIRTDGRLESTAHVTARAASCRADGPRNAGGLRRYDCVLTLDDGRTGSLTVTADADGTWTVVPAK